MAWYWIVLLCLASAGVGAFVLYVLLALAFHRALSR